MVGGDWWRDRSGGVEIGSVVGMMEVVVKEVVKKGVEEGVEEGREKRWECGTGVAIPRYVKF